MSEEMKCVCGEGILHFQFTLEREQVHVYKCDACHFITKREFLTFDGIELV